MQVNGSLRVALLSGGSGPDGIPRRRAEFGQERPVAANECGRSTHKLRGAKQAYQRSVCPSESGYLRASISARLHPALGRSETPRKFDWVTDVHPKRTKRIRRTAQSRATRSVANQNAMPSIAIAVIASTIRQLLGEVSQWLAPLASETHAVNHATDATKAPTENGTLAEAGIVAPTDPRMTRVSSHEAGLPRDITKRRRTHHPSPTLAAKASVAPGRLVAASAACTA